MKVWLCGCDWKSNGGNKLQDFLSNNYWGTAWKQDDIKTNANVETFLSLINQICTGDILLLKKYNPHDKETLIYALGIVSKKCQTNEHAVDVNSWIDFSKNPIKISGGKPGTIFEIGSLKIPQ